MFPQHLRSYIRSLSHIRILVWEEEACVRRFLVLRSCGYAPVEPVRNLRQLRLYVASRRPELIVVSAALHNNALAMVQQVRATEPAIPIVVCTTVRTLESSELSRNFSPVVVVDRSPRQIGKIIGAVQSALAGNVSDAMERVSESAVR